MVAPRGWKGFLDGSRQALALQQFNLQLFWGNALIDLLGKILFTFLLSQLLVQV